MTTTFSRNQTTIGLQSFVIRECWIAIVSIPSSPYQVLGLGVDME